MFNAFHRHPFQLLLLAYENVQTAAAGPSWERAAVTRKFGKPLHSKSWKISNKRAPLNASQPA